MYALVVAPTLFEILGVDEKHANAPEKLADDLRNQFRALSRVLHPDKAVAQGRALELATKDFQLLTLAKNTLADNKNRTRYLKKLQGFRRASGKIPWRFSDASKK